MNTPHKYAEVIKAWANGEEIEWRAFGSSWQKYYKQREESPNFDAPVTEWRIKPETVKYRRYLYKNYDKQPIIGLVNQPYQEGRAEECFKETFIRWIDTEWQEVEI